MRTIDSPQRTTDPPEPAAGAIYVLGGGPLGAAIARRLRAEEREVVLIDESAEASEVGTHHADPTDAAALTEVGLPPDSVVVVATPSDSQNLLAAQLVRAHFDVDRVVVLTNHPDRVEAMADVGHEPICATDALAAVLVDRL